MARFLAKRSQKAGLPPGTLVHVGEKRIHEVRTEVIDYDEVHIEELPVAKVEQCFPFRDKPTVTWINVNGIHDLEVIDRLGTHFGLHPLVLEDIASTGQRPKTELYDEYVFLVVKMLYCQDETEEIQSEQVSVVMGRGFVISFQEREGDVFGQVRERIKTGKGRVRKMGADYLLYSLLDSIVDGYFAVLERLGEKVEALENELTTDPRPRTLGRIHEAKRGMIFLRKSVWPLREAISSLQRGESPLVTQATAIYLRDVYDHTIQVIDTIESFRDIVAGMLDTYLSSVSNKTNEVMKVLTIVATLFIPLTFLAGIYGMNFQHMPELQWRWSYPIVWLFMLAVAACMLVLFRRKKWI